MATYTRRYEVSDDVKKKQQAYSDMLNAQPGAYTSLYQQQIDTLRDDIMNREGFKYDVNADAMYQQLRDQYQQQGRMAMMDTIGQASALTGGYGNSYAQGAGQQAYHGYLQSLNNQIPDLYGMALSRYAQEGDDMARNYSMLLNQDAQDYSRWQDSYNNWQNDISRLYSEYQNAANADYNRFRDEVADDMWQTQYDEALRQYNLAHGLNADGTPIVASTGGGYGGGDSDDDTGGGEDVIPVVTPLSYVDWVNERDRFLTNRRFSTTYDDFQETALEANSSYADYLAMITENNLEAKYGIKRKES